MKITGIISTLPLALAIFSNASYSGTIPNICNGMINLEYAICMNERNEALIQRQKNTIELLEMRLSSVEQELSYMDSPNPAQKPKMAYGDWYFHFITYSHDCAKKTKKSLKDCEAEFTQKNPMPKR